MLSFHSTLIICSFSRTSHSDWILQYNGIMLYITLFFNALLNMTNIYKEISRKGSPNHTGNQLMRSCTLVLMCVCVELMPPAFGWGLGYLMTVSRFSQFKFPTETREKSFYWKSASQLQAASTCYWRKGFRKRPISQCEWTCNGQSSVQRIPSSCNLSEVLLEHWILWS